MKTSTLFGFIVIGQFIGYPAIAGISDFFGVSNSWLSILLRASILTSSIIIIAKRFGTGSNNLQKILIFLGSSFWLLYIIRIFYSTLIAHTPLSKPPEYFWIWSIGGCMVPFFALSCIKHREINIEKLLNYFFYTALISSVFIIKNSSTYTSNSIDFYDSERLRLETLNPISLGHFGATLLLISLLKLFNQHQGSKFNLIFSSAGLAAGGYLLITANSFGPLVAACIVLFFWLFTSTVKRRITYSILLIGIFFLFEPSLKYLENVYGIGTYSRIFSNSITEAGSALDRFELYKDAYSIFSENPVLGGGLEIEKTQSYPHNVIIESFMATGILGGLSFLIMIITAIISTIRTVKINRSFLWMISISLQYIVSAQFSGALYSSTTFWTAVGLIIYSTQFSKNSQPPQKKHKLQLS